MSDQLIKTDVFLEQLKKGSSPYVKQDSTIVVDDKEPSAIGGLLALGATAIGTTMLAKRFPFLKKYFTVPKQKPLTQYYKPNKTVEFNEVPTATGQASELTLTPSKALTVSKPKSRYSEVRDIPFTTGKGYTQANPLVGSSTYDWVMEAPFDKAPAQQWIKWLNRGNQQHPVPGGTALAGVSRRVNPEELLDLNILATKDNQVTGGFLKYAADRNLEVSRDTLLDMVKNSPLNKINVLRLGVRGEPVNDLIKLRQVINKETDIKAFNEISKPDDVSKLTEYSQAKNKALEQIDRMMEGSVFDHGAPIDARAINRFQEALTDLAKLEPNKKQFYGERLKEFNRITGNYNEYSRKPTLGEFNQPTNTYVGKPNFYPSNKSKYSYHLQAGDNFTEDIIYFKGPVPNVTSGQFRGDTHYLKNEIGFIRYDDLPNPNLGPGRRHIRISEIQSDIHQPRFDSDRGSRERYFKRFKVPFNQDVLLKDFMKQRQALTKQLEPYTDLGRGIAGLTKTQSQELARLQYKLSQLDKETAAAFLTKGGIESTTAAPLGRNFADYAIKNVLRNMAERNVNAVSIVPAAMNQNVKTLGNINNVGNEINYGLMDGRALAFKNGKYVKSKELANNVKVLKRIANQYGAKFEMFPMPKSNPNKPFKVIEQISSRNYTGGGAYDDLVRRDRAHYNTKVGDEYIYENHLGAFDTLDEAEYFLKSAERHSMNTSGKIMTKYITPDAKDNYEIVPTLIADNEVLKKFLLPMKAYMKVGGYVEKTNIFKSLI
jgi:hypothetical protein